MAETKEVAWEENKGRKGEKERESTARMEEWENTEKGKKTNDKANPPLPQLPLAASGWEGIEKTGHHGLCCHVSEQITLPHPSTSISRSSREYHEENNDNVEKIIIIESLRSKTTAVHVHHAFSYYDMNSTTFYEESERMTTNFPFFLWTWKQPSIIQK